LLALACRDDTVRLWDVFAGKLHVPWERKRQRIYGVAFSPDGKALALAGEGGTIWLYEVATGLVRAELKGHRGTVYTVRFSPDGKRLASGAHDTTVLVWGLDRAVHAGRPGLAPSSDEELARLWSDLAGADAARAYRAIWVLATSSRMVPFLARRLRPAVALERAQFDGLLAGLDSDDPKVRQRAQAHLQTLGEGAEPALRKALAGKPSAEVSRQLRRWLRWLRPEQSAASGPCRQALRAIEALELAGTPSAKAVLKRLAAGTDVQLTRSARAALARLNRRTRP
jgi:hypothetical protein